LPIVLEEPPAESEAEAGAVLGPDVSLRVTDNVGVSSVYVSYELSGSAGSGGGTLRLAQSATDPDTFEGRIPIDAGATAPGSIVTYDVKIADFDGNEVEIPSTGTPYRIVYVFVAREDKLVGATPSGGWEPEDEGWLVSSQTYSAGTASLVLSPIDLPNDAAGIRFELLHDYHMPLSAKADVNVSTDGGRTWETIEPTDGYSQTETGFQEQADGVLSVFSLDSYAGRQVQLRIEFYATESLSKDDFWRIQSATVVLKAEGDRFTIPRSLKLHPNFPDPFRNTTTLSYTIPEPTIVNLAVYDILGRRVAQIVDEPMEPGTYTTHWNANALAAGTYFLQLQTKSGLAVEAISVIQ
ncbi:MAG: T9SS type A sorting domain-containing protein, partial [Rhodothermia bacterium]